MDAHSHSRVTEALQRARPRGWFLVALLPIVFFLVPTGTPAEKKSLERPKPHINIVTLGQIGHGKTALTSAITKVLADADKAKFVPARRLRNTPEERERGLPIAIARVEYETEKRRYAHADMPTHADYVKGMIAGAVRMDGAILVVSANHGPTSETQKHVFLAGQVGIPEIVVFLNEVTRVEGPELGERAEADVRALLSSHGFAGDDIPVIRGSARRALEASEEATGKQAVLDLIAAMDEHIPQPERAKDLSFLMPAEDVFSIAGRGTVVTGRVERGMIEVGDEVEIVGLNDTTRTVVVTGVEMFRKLLDQAHAGDNVGLLLRGVDRDQVQRGQVLAKPGSITAHDRFKAEVYFLTKEEGGRSAPVFSGDRPQFYFRTTDVTGLVKLPDKIETAMPGDNVTIEVDLERPIAMQKGLRFAIRDGGRTNGIGIVTEILN